MLGAAGHARAGAARLIGGIDRGACGRVGQPTPDFFPGVVLVDVADKRIVCGHAAEQLECRRAATTAANLIEVAGLADVDFAVVDGAESLRLRGVGADAEEVHLADIAQPGSNIFQVLIDIFPKKVGLKSGDF